MTKYRPIRDKIIIEVDSGEEKSKGGLIIAAEGSLESQARDSGIVLAIGKSCFSDGEPEDLVVGNKVSFPRYAGKILERLQGGKTIQAIRDIDILCIIEEEINE